MQQPSPYKDIDLVELFYAENVDLKAILNSRKSRKVVTSGLEPYSGDWGKVQKKHLLNRVLMGYAHRHLLDLDNLNLSEALELIFTPESKPEPPVNDYFHEMTQAEIEAQGHVYVPPGEPYVEVAEPSGSPWPRHQSLYAWIYRNQLNQNTSIHYKMIFFLHNLLACGRASVKKQYKHMDMLFDSVFRSYKETIKALTIDPMMLDYLNLQFSNKNYPDENYARELQELFTVGKGPNSKYTEDDIVAAAKILVGWRYTWESQNNQGPLISKFDQWNHDTSDKQFSAFYGNRIIQGREGEDGALELDELLDMIFETNECAMYLSRRLYHFFVYPLIDETIETNIITPLAELIRTNNYQLMPALKTLLGSEHFFDNSFYSAMLKSPIEYVFGQLKEFDFEIKNYQDETDIPSRLTAIETANFYQYRPIDWVINNQGLNFLEPPSVSGWPAYYQAPVFDLFWINSYTISNRADWGNSIGRWGLGLIAGDNNGWVHLVIDKTKYLLSLTNPTDIDSVIDEMADRLLGAPLQDAARIRIRNEVLNGNSSSYFTQLVNTYTADPSQINKNTLDNRVEQLLANFFQLGEIHLF